MMKQNIRSKVWWPHVDKDVEKFVKGCRDCQLTLPYCNPEPLKPRVYPDKPWDLVAMDFLTLPGDIHLLVIIDYFSKFLIIEWFKSTTSEKIIRVLNKIFAQFGFPRKIQADNASNFTSEELKQYLETCGVQLSHTTPLWPKGNGEVERQNRSLMKVFRIAQLNKFDFKKCIDEYMLMYHSSPHSTTGVSPFELMFNRKMRTKLPDVDDLQYVWSELFDNSEIINRLTESHDTCQGELRERVLWKQFKTKEYYDSSNKVKERNIQIGDDVLVKNDKKSNKLSVNYYPQPFKVTDKKGSMVELTSPEGIKYNRNSSFLRKLDNNNDSSEEGKEVMRSGSTVSMDIGKGDSSEKTNEIIAAGNGNSAGQEKEGPIRPKRKIKKPSWLEDFI